MRSFPAVLLLAIATSAFAQATMKVDPLITNPQRSVDVTFGPSWGTGCPPESPTVKVSGSTIAITFTVPNLICTDDVVPWNPTIHLGNLPAGVYDVIATVPQLNLTIGRTQLIVRDSDNIHIRPTIAVGSMPTTVWMEDGRDVKSVTIDGVTAPVDINRTFVPPPHAGGTVDVTVNLATGESLVAKAALTYDDPSAPADPRFFEPVFIPIAFRGAGAFDTSWITVNRLYTDGAPVLFRSALPCTKCVNSVDYFGKTLDTTNDPSGVMLYLLREAGTGLHVQSRIRELTHGTMGTSIPIARDGDFVAGVVRIVGVPVSTTARTMLRVRTLGDVPAGSILGVSLGQNTFKTFPFTGNAAAVDLTSMIAEATLGREIDLSASVGPPGVPSHVLLWAFVTVTNNVTQEVTIVAP